MNGFFYFSGNFYTYHPNENCIDEDPKNILIRSVFLAVGEFIMHFLPVMIILYIYRPPEAQKNFYGSFFNGNIINNTNITLD